MFADWTDRIAAARCRRRRRGRRASSATSSSRCGTGPIRRPTCTTWSRPIAAIPTVNANGPIYGALELSADYLPVLDPGHAHREPGAAHGPRSEHAADVAEDAARRRRTGATRRSGRARTTSTTRCSTRRAACGSRRRCAAADNPDLLQGGIDASVGEAVPARARAAAPRGMYDPKTKKLTHISTCFGTHHLMFAEDANHTLWTSGGGQVVGWLNTKMFDETGDEEKSQGWTALIIDTNGNGKRDAYVEPNQPVDPTKDKRFGAAFYAVAPAPDGSVWGTVLGFPGAIVRLDAGIESRRRRRSRRSTSRRSTIRPKRRSSSRRAACDVDRNGVVWAALASGHLASFDRRKCKGPLNGPKATGQHCPEGWTLYPSRCRSSRASPTRAAPRRATTRGSISSTRSGSARTRRSTPATRPKALLALKDGKWVVLRVPYPMGFYTKWMDGRIDDPNAGWKGRGIWATISTRAPFHMERRVAHLGRRSGRHTLRAARSDQRVNFKKLQIAWRFKTDNLGARPTSTCNRRR